MAYFRKLYLMTLQNQPLRARLSLLCVALFSGLAALPAVAAAPARYFVGQLELDINGETVAYQRSWICEETTIFRPAGNDLFEKHYLQAPVPPNFVALRTATGRAVIFANWTGCEFERQRIDEMREITVYDNADEPTYGERFFTRLGAPTASIPYPLKHSFQVRVVKDSKKELDLAQYEALKPTSSSTGGSILNRLIQKAAYSLEVAAIAWNTTGKRGAKTPLTFTEEGWVVPELLAPQPIDQIFDNKRPPPNTPLLPMPLQTREPGIPVPLRVSIGKRVVEMNDKGFGELLPPPPGLTKAVVWARVTKHSWSSRCTLVPPPECPKPLP